MKHFQNPYLEVRVLNGDIEAAIGKLKGRMHKLGLFKTIKLKAHYEKPSEKRRRKLEESMRKLKRAELKRQNRRNRRRKQNK